MYKALNKKITKILAKVLTWVIILFITFSCKSGSESNKIVIFAASSLSNVVSELALSYQDSTQTQITISTSSSGTLARQIHQGARADIFLSASENWVDYVMEQRKVQYQIKRQVAANKLVVVTNQKIENCDSSVLCDLLIHSESRIAMGDPVHVPAGKYAKESLETFGLWNKVKDNILPTKDVRSASQMVELGECAYGLVYESDIMHSKALSVLFTFTTDSHSAIGYYATMDSNSTRESTTLLFLDYLNSEGAQGIWRKHGFTIE